MLDEAALKRLLRYLRSRWPEDSAAAERVAG
jgi:hypothetical protein